LQGYLVVCGGSLRGEKGNRSVSESKGGGHKQRKSQKKKIMRGKLWMGKGKVGSKHEADLPLLWAPEGSRASRENEE